LLAKEGIDCVYCPDNALGLLFYKQKIKRALIARGSGSLYVALLCKVHKVPFEVVEPGPVNREGLDRDAATLEGRNFILEVNKEEYIIEPDEELIDKEALA
jgi:methylthioribose-1-phosphate isomerase